MHTAELRVSFSAGTYAIMKDDLVVKADYKTADTIANLANLAADYGKIVDITKTDDGIMAMRITFPDDLLERVLDETNILVKQGAPLGHVGYVLGLHSAVYVGTDSHGNPMGIGNAYRGVVEAMHVRRGAYMDVSLSKSVVDNKERPFYLEDYIYLRQLEREGVIEAAPANIPTETFEELLTSLDKMLKLPSLLYTKRGREFLAKRYVGIVVGMLVKWGYKHTIPGLVGLATGLALDDKIPTEIYQALTDAVKLAQRWGDL